MVCRWEVVVRPSEGKLVQRRQRLDPKVRRQRNRELVPYLKTPIQVRTVRYVFLPTFHSYVG